MREFRDLLNDAGTLELPQEQDGGHGGPQEKCQKSWFVQALPQGQAGKLLLTGLEEIHNY